MKLWWEIKADTEITSENMKTFVGDIGKFAKDCGNVETPGMSDQCFVAFKTVEDKYKIWKKETNIIYKGMDYVAMVSSMITAYSTCFWKKRIELTAG